MTPDEVIENIIENLKSLNDRDKDRLMRHIHNLNRDIEMFDKDVYSDASDVLEDLGLYGLTISNRDYWEGDILPDMQYVNEDEE